MTPNELLILRREAGITQAELGKRIGYSRFAVSKWENKEFPIPENAVPAIVQACTVHLPKVDNTAERAARRLAKDTFDAYELMRNPPNNLSDEYIMAMWAESNFVPSVVAMEMIRNAYPDAKGGTK